MDKKEINSPTLTANFLFWVCGVGGILLIFLHAQSNLGDFLGGMHVVRKVS